MDKTEELKQKIIDVTTELIVKSNGDISKVTTRAIAEKANIGIGLINYHFRTKESLIELCVQRIIGNVIASFKPDTEASMNSKERLKAAARGVTDFLVNHEAVARISILGDCNSPDLNDNTVRTMKGFAKSLEKDQIPDQEKSVLVFALTSIIQSIFLRREMCSELLGFDFYSKKERDLFLDVIIDRLFMKEGE